MGIGKVVGIGNTATVYQWEEDKVLKLFHKGFPKESVEKEFKNASLIWNMDFLKPKAYELVTYEGKLGIIYDRLEGESLLDWFMRTRDIEKCAVYMSKLHKRIISNRIEDVPSYKDFLRNNVKRVDLKGEEVTNLIDRLPDGGNLCHGDFHPGNIFIHNGNTAIIDFMNICHGPYLYDIARTVFLLEYSPLPMEVKNGEKLLKLRKTLSDLYLKKMDVSREMIEDFLSVIISARIGEEVQNYHYDKRLSHNDKGLVF